VSDLLSHLNEQQQAAVLHPEGPALVLAGAGSGKTTVLTTRAAWLLKEKKLAPHQILLVTFTNKAANEIKERVLELTESTLPFAGTFHSLSAKILRIDGE
jgi:DNA helicase II / ATP-dependent DNA helicase PcrA